MEVTKERSGEGVVRDDKMEGGWRGAGATRSVLDGPKRDG